MESKTRIKGNVHYVGVNDRNMKILSGILSESVFEKINIFP